MVIKNTQQYITTQSPKGETTQMGSRKRGEKIEISLSFHRGRARSIARRLVAAGFLGHYEHRLREKAGNPIKGSMIPGKKRATLRGKL